MAYLQIVTNIDIKCYFLRINFKGGRIIPELNSEPFLTGKNRGIRMLCFHVSLGQLWYGPKPKIAFNMLKEVAAEGVLDSQPGSRDRGTQIHDDTKIKLRKCLILKKNFKKTYIPTERTIHLTYRKRTHC